MKAIRARTSGDWVGKSQTIWIPSSMEVWRGLIVDKGEELTKYYRESFKRMRNKSTSKEWGEQMKAESTNYYGGSGERLELLCCSASTRGRRWLARCDSAKDSVRLQSTTLLSYLVQALCFHLVFQSYLKYWTHFVRMSGLTVTQQHIQSATNIRVSRNEMVPVFDALCTGTISVCWRVCCWKSGLCTRAVESESREKSKNRKKSEKIG